MPQPALTIRRATRTDLPTAARLAARLVRLHHELDRQRFFLPDDVEAGYAWWLGQELDREQVVVLVAELDSVVVGYCYGRLEGRDWNQLLDACGAIHDVWVEEQARGRGVATRLMEEMVAALRAKGAPRVVLHTAAGNQVAQRLFERMGFRRTMIEMTLECGSPS